MSSWFAAAGLLTASWIFLTVFAAIIAPGNMRKHWPWAAGTTGVVLALAAGAYLVGHWPQHMIHWIIGLHDIVWIVVMCGGMLWLATSCVAVLPASIASAVAASTGIALFVFILPAAVAAGVFPGKFGLHVSNGVVSASTFLQTQTHDWFDPAVFGGRK